MTRSPCYRRINEILKGIPNDTATRNSFVKIYFQRYTLEYSHQNVNNAVKPILFGFGLFSKGQPKKI